MSQIKYDLIYEIMHLHYKTCVLYILDVIDVKYRIKMGLEYQQQKSQGNCWKMFFNVCFFRIYTDILPIQNYENHHSCLG